MNKIYGWLKEHLYISVLILAVVTLLVVLVSFTLFDPPQCPNSFSQAQIDSSNCIVGANIGGGWCSALAIGAPLSAVTVFLLVLAIRKTLRNKQ